MTDANPYHAPLANDGAVPAVDDAKIQQVASGQKIIIIGILVYFAAIFGRFILGPVVGLVALVTLVLGIVGIIRLSQGLGYHVALVILFLVLMLIPLVGLIVLLVLNGKATARLRAAGYRVGSSGRPSPPEAGPRRAQLTVTDTGQWSLPMTWGWMVTSVTRAARAGETVP